MIRMAARSSKIASVSRNTFNGSGTRRPNRLSSASANAISVATGIPHPSSATGSFQLMAA